MHAPTELYKAFEHLFEDRFAFPPPPSTPAEDVPVLERLLQDPESRLPPEAANKYAHLQAKLLSDDKRLRQIAAGEISFLILKATNDGKNVLESLLLAKNSFKLKFTTVDFTNLNSTAWRALATFIAAFEVFSLQFSGRTSSIRLINKLEQVTDTGWQAFCFSLQSRYLLNLGLNGCNLKRVNLSRLQLLKSAMNQSGIKNFSFEWRGLKNWDSNSWEVFYSILQSVGSLKIQFFKLPSINFMLWQKFWLSLKSPTLKSLNLSYYSCFFTNTDYWLIMVTSLLDSSIEKLTIDIALNELDETCWQAFLNLINKQLRYLHLNGNLPKLNDCRLQEFCQAIQSPRLYALDLWSDDLFKLSDAAWQMFWDSIKCSDLRSLNVRETYITTMTARRWQTAIAAMEKQYLCIIEGLPKNTPAELNTLIARNKNISLSYNHALNILSTKQESNQFLEQMDDAINQLTNILTMVEGATVGTKKLCLEISTLIDRLYWKKGCWLRDNLAHDQDIEQVTAPWLMISGTSQLFIIARLEVFLMVYATLQASWTLPTSGGTSPHDSSEAFLSALPCLIHEGKFIIGFKEINRSNEDYVRVLDGYLFAAAGGKGALNNRVLSESIRVALLQQVLLLAIRKLCKAKLKAPCPYGSFFSADALVGLRRMLQGLPTITSGCVDEHQQRQLNDIWIEAQQRLTIVSLLDDQELLLTAINHLAADNQQSFRSHQHASTR